MKKYSFLVFYKDLDDFLSHLQEFGVVDITRSQKTLEGKDKEMLSLYTQYAIAVRKLKTLKVEQPKQLSEKLTGEQILKKYEVLVDKQEQAGILIKSVTKELKDIEVWGSLNPADIERLQQLGFKPHFYYTPRKRYSEEWEQQYVTQILNEDKSNVYFVVLQQGSEPLNIQAQELKAPTAKLEDKEAELQRLQESYKSIINRLNELAGYVPVLQDEMVELSNRIDYSSAKQSAEGKADDKIMLLTGWLPEDKQPDLEDFLNEQSVLHLEEQIKEEDSVPIKLKNNKFARLFEPITQMYSLPHYREVDVTAFFAPFYMLFFGFCLGDAGYGILLLLIATLIKPKLKLNQKPYASLMQWLGVAALIFGSFTGSVFGIALTDANWVSDTFKGWYVKTSDHTTLMILSIALGAIQVFLGMGIDAYNIAKQKGFKYAVEKIAWLVGLLSLAAVIGLPYIGVALPTLISYVLYGLVGISFLAIFFYNNPGKNPIINFGGGIWNSFNMATGLLGDLLSYVRLFAIGLTGGMLGGAFNNMAQMLSPDIPVVGFFVSFLILIFGHSLNFGLSMLSSLIHPIRLTFVEFFKNAGYEGGGKAYSPFKYNQPK
ncbi:MAG: ATPase [Prevotellaceae bacterium]|nr:ATPase [Prevotellaceae bacterium]